MLVDSVLLGVLVAFVPPLEVGVLDVSGVVFRVIELIDVRRECLMYCFLKLCNLVRRFELLVVTLSVFP